MASYDWLGENKWSHALGPQIKALGKRSSFRFFSYNSKDWQNIQVTFLLNSIFHRRTNFEFDIVISGVLLLSSLGKWEAIAHGLRTLNKKKCLLVSRNKGLMSKALPGLIDVFAILSFSFLVGTKLKTLMNCLS